MGGGAGGGIGWVGHGHHPVVAAVMRRRAARKVMESAEAMMTEPMSPETLKHEMNVALWFGFALGLIVGLLIGWLVWELT